MKYARWRGEGGPFRNVPAMLVRDYYRNLEKNVAASVAYPADMPATGPGFDAQSPENKDKNAFLLKSTRQ